jgi:predicted branched-subunit amino acid permease
LYVVWAASTITGALLGALIPDPGALGLDLIFPLTFIAFTMPMMRDGVNRAVIAVAAVVSILSALWLPGSWYVLITGLLASAVGALLATRWPQLATKENTDADS